jgi:arylsulfatase A-like enzyme
MLPSSQSSPLQGYHNQRYDAQVQTPTMDALSADGVRLEGYYTQSVCTPTRAALLSGK